MKKCILFAFLTCFVITASALPNNVKPGKKILVFFLTKGYHHNSIANGLVALQKIGSENNLQVDTTTNPALFTTENLANYKAIVFLNPTGTGLFNDAQKLAFKGYINNGGGFVGIHAATDCNYEWEWYGKMVGGYFESHPKTQEAKIYVVDKKHPASKVVPNPWVHTDEWYNFKSFNPDVTVIMKVDEKSYKEGKMGDNHPVAWYHEYDGGKAFYTALGHTEACYTDEVFLKHLTGGIKWAIK